MKFDMSGGAAVLEALGAVARLGLPLRVVAVVGATENMPSDRAMRPATSSAPPTARRSRSTTPTPRAGWSWPTACCTPGRLGAERLVDVATLTGGDRRARSARPTPGS